MPQNICVCVFCWTQFKVVDCADFSDILSIYYTSECPDTRLSFVINIEAYFNLII
jgi:hypothetical protein